jgi:hypothetical protein
LNGASTAAVKPAADVDLDEGYASKPAFTPKTEKAPVKAPAKEVDFDDDDDSLSYFAKLAED